jgi:uncharacterized membrane protein
VFLGVLRYNLEYGANDATPAYGRLRRSILSIQRTLPRQLHPALIKHAETRAKDLQNRIADVITSFAGSMTFVYVHIVWFAVWIASGVEKFPFGFLTMMVSLEAIFLSTFVMISQNRADEKREALAAHQWEIIQLEKDQNDRLIETVELEKQQNEQLIEMSQRILDLTTEVHELTGKVHSMLESSAKA